MLDSELARPTSLLLQHHHRQRKILFTQSRAAANPAIAFRLQSARPVGRVAELGSLGQNRMTVTLREVTKGDLPIFFEHQLDAEATRMAAFPSRDRDAFMAHWARIMSNETGILNTILADDTVAGNVVYWEAAGEPNIGYWLGKTHWGKGIASAALAQFLTKIEARPVYAHVAKHNFASIRVLHKCGFQLAREDMCDGDDGEELVMELRSDRCATAANKPTKT
jgi:RimJ/RimL family protein N-acetyltransferase